MFDAATARQGIGGAARVVVRQRLLPLRVARPEDPVAVRLKSTKSRLIAVVFLAGVVVAAVPALRWRTAVIACKITGQLVDVSWQDLVSLLRPDSGVKLSKLVYYRDPYRAVSNPRDSAPDIARGRATFASNCARCHGEAARGGVGPALIGRALTHGDSDWAIYRTILRGVPGTAMLPVAISRDDAWRVIAFLRDANTQLDQAQARDRSGVAALPPAPVVESNYLQSAADDSTSWALPSGTYNAQRFSKSTEIDTRTVPRLSVRWIHQFGTAETNVIESTPIVIGSRLYATLPTGSVIAMDAKTGEQIWRFDRPVPGDTRLCCLAANRGVAALGDKIYVGTLDAHLIALDANSGRVAWDQTVADYRDGYSITSAPLPVGDTVVTGIAGSDFPTRGFVTAYDAKTGEKRWRFNTIPGPGEPGHDSWGGDSWETGGAAAWGLGSYDPELGLIYWGTGNPAPDFNAAKRLGDNLYSNCVLALDAKTGRLVWHFQFSPGDDHDWDSTQTPVLVDTVTDGTARKLLVVANRNGFFYVLDRRNGKFVRGGPFAKQTWASGLTAEGRPVRLEAGRPKTAGATVYPSVVGATTWWPAAYSPLTQLYYVDVLERRGIFFADERASSPSHGKRFTGSAGTLLPDDGHYSAIRAIDPSTATVRWEHRNATDSDLPRGGVLATAGGVVFASETSKLVALSAESGEQLWSFETGGPITAAPVTYQVDGHQVIAVIAGQSLMVFGLPEPAGK